jgi:hypothetical protein
MIVYGTCNIGPQQPKLNVVTSCLNHSDVLVAAELSRSGAAVDTSAGSVLLAPMATRAAGREGSEALQFCQNVRSKRRMDG